jgi:hypothetical protein
MVADFLATIAISLIPVNKKLYPIKQINKY